MKIEPGQTLIIMDPCYMDAKEMANSEEQGGTLRIANPLPGNWMYQVDKSNGIIVGLQIQHYEACAVSECAGTVGVDSGQIGIFIEQMVPDDPVEYGYRDVGDKTFLTRCCDQTSDHVGYGVVREGLVTLTGYGDGEYPVCVAKKIIDGVEWVVGLDITFVDSSTDSDDDFYSNDDRYDLQDAEWDDDVDQK